MSKVTCERRERFKTHQQETFVFTYDAVKQVFLLAIADSLLVGIVKVLRQDNVTVLTNRLESSFGTDRADIGMRNFFTSIHIILQVQLVAEVHFRRGGLKDHSLLSSIRWRKFNLAIQASRTKQGRIESIRTVGSHNYLDVG